MPPPLSRASDRYISPASSSRIRISSNPYVFVEFQTRLANYLEAKIPKRKFHRLVRQCAVARGTLWGRIVERGGFGCRAITEHVFDVDHPDDAEGGSEERRCPRQVENPARTPRTICADKVNAGGRCNIRRCPRGTRMWPSMR